MRKIEVVDYDPDWPKTFERLCSRIWAALSDVALSIEHVGSRSVPGLAAKPIIDISIVVPKRSDVQTGISRLATLGYVHRGNLGIEGREAFVNPDSLPMHNLYLCPRDIAWLLPTILQFETTYAPIQKQRGSMVNSKDAWQSVFRMTLTVMSTVR